MSSFLGAIYRVLKKDLQIERRTKQVTTTVAVFALLVVLTFAFSFVQTLQSAALLGRGALWVAFVFAGTFGVTKTIELEDRNGALDGLLIAPIDRSAIYLGKVLSTTVFIFAVSLLTLGATSVFLGYSPSMSTAAAIVGVLLVSSVGFSAIGVVVSILTFRSGLDELALPVLLVPLVVPLLLAGVELTTALESGAPLGGWLRLLTLYTGIVLLAGIATFEYVVEE